MHHPAVSLPPPPLPYISWELTCVPHPSGAAGLHTSGPQTRAVALAVPNRSKGQPAFGWISRHFFFLNVEFPANLVQQTVCYCKGRKKTKRRAVRRHLAPHQWIKSLWKVYLPNKAALCTEQSVSEAEKWRSQTTWIRARWEELPLLFCTVIRLSGF